MPGTKGHSGGARNNAGRPLGSRNRRIPVAELEKLSGETPLAYMLRILRDETQPADRRDRMAAPYVHPRLSNVGVVKTVFEMTDEELLATKARTEAQLAEREGRAPLKA